MRKQKLIMAAFALLLGWSTASAADLPASGSGEFVLKNVGTGTYLKGDSYWGTKAVVWDDPYFVTLTYVSEGKYTIKSQQNNGGQNQYISNGDDPYVDRASAELTFTEVDAENHYYTISNDKGFLYAKSQTEDGADLYIVMPGGDAESNYARWQIISRDELVAALSAASSSNPVDATFYIKDAGIDVKSVNADSWTTTNVALGGGGNAGHSAESWNSASFSMSQTVTGLPNGKYRATCHGYYRWNNGEDNNNKAAIAGHKSGNEVLNAIFFAGSEETPLMSVAGDDDARTFCNTMEWPDDTPNQQWQAGACFTKGYYLNTINDVIVTDGTLNIGVRKTTQAGTDWAVFDEFKLYYLGEDISIYEAPLADAKTAASSVDQEAPMNASVLSALQSAISTYGSKEFASYSTVEEITTAINALNTAASNANTSISNYEDALSILNAASSLDAAGQASYAANETVAAIQSAYDARTLEAVSSAQQTACATALRTAAKAQTTEGADMTLAIVNPSFETGNTTGWTYEASDDHGAKLNSNATYTMTNCDGYYLFNIWSSGNAISQEINDLPNGVFKLEAYIATDEDHQVQINANDQSAKIDAVGKGTGVLGEVNFTVIDNTATIGAEGVDKYWYKVDDFRLTYVRAVTVADYKEVLNDAITAASGARKAANEGTGVFQIPAAAGTTLASAISAAQSVYDDAGATISDVTTAITTLNAAVETYEATTLNAPDAEKRYNIIVATTGHAKNGNAIVESLGATSANNPTGYAFNASATPNVNLAQAVKFTQVSGNTYNISFETSEGVVYLTYGSLNGSAAGWADSQIQGTTNAENKGDFKIVASTTANQFYIYNTITNTTIDCQAGGVIYTDNNNTVFTVAEAAQASVAINISNADKYATRIFPFTPSLPSGIKAYSCKESDGYVLTLVEVGEPQANTPYILEAESGCSSTNLTGWGVLSSLDAKNVGWLTGVYTDTPAPNGSYVLQNNNDRVAFYLVTSEAIPTVGANRCYLTVPSGGDARAAFFFNDNETTGINALNALTSGNATIYDVNGRQVPSLQKGMNIVKANGKSYKVVVK